MTRLAWFSHAVVGLLHVQICLSHFSRGVYEGRPMDTAGETFFHSQLATSMDIDCWTCLDWLHGGLQFQASAPLPLPLGSGPGSIARVPAPTPSSR